MDFITYAILKKRIDKVLDGAGIIKGEPGDPGKSAYEIAVEKGYEGTEEEWLDQLKGTDGYTPYIGENGNWFINEVDTGVSATGGAKDKEGNNINLVVDIEQKTISAENGEGDLVVVANYTQVESIEDSNIEVLF